MKKIIVSLLAALLILSIFTGCSSLGITPIKEIKYVISDDHAAVKELPDRTGINEVTIADEYEGLPVTEIMDFAGCNLEYVEKIIIGKNIDTIGTWAFTNNQNLKEFEVSPENENFCTVDGAIFSKDMKTILFYPCSGAEKFNIPDSVEIIRSHAFYRCEKLTKVTLPSSLISVEEKAFFRCSNIGDVTLADTVETIGKDAFANCQKFTKITIPASIKSIGDYAFFNCKSLLDITVNAKESDIELGKEWQPTDNGIAIGELKITFEK